MLFSLICLTYKRPELLEECIYSVLQQTLSDWELLIINDCETQTFFYDHPKIRIFNLAQKFKNISDKRNFGKAAALGEWIMNVDDDDILLPSYLQNIKNIIDVSRADWISCQPPIIYFNNPIRVYLSPVPQTNAFFYTRKVAQQVNYESNGNNELNSFYHRTKNLTGQRNLFVRFKPANCGYVWRQGTDRKYSLTTIFASNTTEDAQDALLRSINHTAGDIKLVPKWREDYTTIIQQNMKIIPPSVILKKNPGGANMFQIVQNIINDKKLPEEIIGSMDAMASAPVQSNSFREEWKKVKPSWANASKFLTAAKSRGILSTVLAVSGIDNTAGERVSDDILNRRRLSCFGNKTAGIEPCVKLRHVKNKGHFCGSCGCGDTDLAKLDSGVEGEYTKLHYPQLECPLRRRGFSNERKVEYLSGPNEVPISIIIPVLNDNEELNFTINSIRETSPENTEIIVIDDASDSPATVKDEKVKLFRFDERRGAGQARHFGALNATSKQLLFIDSHMRFDPDWFNNAMARIISTPTTLWCGACLGLNSSNMDMTHPVGVYTGADFVLHKNQNNTIFDGVWRPDVKDKDDYEISCVMGACYFINKEWYFYTKGLEQTMMWGSEEPILSVKTWLAGGQVRLMKSVRLGHKFRDTAPYSTPVSTIHYNKLAYMYMLFNPLLYEKMKSKFIQDGNYQEALDLVKRNKVKLDKEKKYYDIIMKHDIKWLCEKFNIPMP